jgi:hypothetical protein
MGSRGIGEETLTVEHEQLVNAVGKNLVFHLALDAGTGNDSVELHTQFVGQLAAFSKQFLRNLGNLCAFDFAIYKYVVHILNL